MKSTYVGTRSANVGDIRCLFALASDSTSCWGIVFTHGVPMGGRREKFVQSVSQKL